MRPGEGIGPLQLGMTRKDAMTAGLAAGFAVDAFARAGGPKTDLVLSGQLFVYFDAAGRVDEVEVAVPQGVDPRRVPVSCLGLPLAAPYDELLRRMRDRARADERDPEHPGTSAYPDLGLVLWADTKTEDLAEVRVQAILVRRAEPDQIR